MTAQAPITDKRSAPVRETMCGCVLITLICSACYVEGLFHMNGLQTDVFSCLYYFYKDLCLVMPSHFITMKSHSL